MYTVRRFKFLLLIIGIGGVPKKLTTEMLLKCVTSSGTELTKVSGPAAAAAAARGKGKMTRGGTGKFQL